MASSNASADGSEFAVLIPECPDLDDTMRQLGVAGVGPNTPLYELIELIRSDRQEEAAGTQAAFGAVMRQVVHIHWLHKNISRGKGARAAGQTVGGAEFVAAAKQAGIRKTTAYQIVQRNVFVHLPEILARVESERATSRSKNGTDSYMYPSLHKVLSWYPSATAKADPPGEAGGAQTAPIVPAKQLRRNLHEVTEVLAATRSQLEQARNGSESERAAHSQAVGDYESQLAQKDLRIKELEAEIMDLRAQILAGTQRSMDPVPATAVSARPARRKRSAEVKDLERHDMLPANAGQLGLEPAAEPDDALIRARSLASVRLGPLIADAEDDVDSWEKGLPASPPLASLHGPLERRAQARALRRRAVMAVEALLAELPEANAFDHQAIFQVTSSKWWIDHGEESLDFIVRAARQKVTGHEAETPREAEMADENTAPGERHQ